MVLQKHEVAKTEKKVIIKDYAQEAENYDKERYVGDVNEYNEKVREKIIHSILDVDSGMMVLDVGTGTGRGMLYFVSKCKRVIGVDGTFSMLAKAKEKIKYNDNAELQVADALKLPFKDNSFDMVTTFNFLHLFRHPKKQSLFVNEMKRVLKKDGILFIELDNALHGLILGFIRKYFIHNIGYNWPWQIKSIIGKDVEVIKIAGSNLPGIWRVFLVNRRISAFMEKLTSYFPFNYLGYRMFVKAKKL